MKTEKEILAKREAKTKQLVGEKSKYGIIRAQTAIYWLDWVLDNEY